MVNTMIHALIQTIQVDRARVEIYSSNSAQGSAAAAKAAMLLRSAIQNQGRARMIVATGNSQLPVIKALVARADLDWSKTEVFHMDEYVGLSDTHPASFRLWIKTQVADRVQTRIVHYLAGDAPDSAEECRRYKGLLLESPVDVCLLGIGENGHIAFNDPHVADFNDPETVKLVELDARCRQQQVGEGHFASLDEVPRQALTLTCPALMQSRHLICCVPEIRKAEAVRNALEGPVTVACPGSVLRTHQEATIFLDIDSASLLARRS